MGFWAYEHKSELQLIGVITYNTSCDPSPGLLPDGTTTQYQQAIPSNTTDPKNETASAQIYETNASIVTTVTIILVMIFLGLLIMCIIVIALYERHIQKQKEKRLKETQDKYRSEQPQEQVGPNDQQKPSRTFDDSGKKPFATLNDIN